jgi:hypothetical protein
MTHVLSEQANITPKHTFIRSYQACVPCRKRKVKCDLGDPGNPSDPPCRRCRREHKDCYFQDLRMKKSGTPPATESPRSPKRIRSELPSNSPPRQVHRASPPPLIDPPVEHYQPLKPANATHIVPSMISPNESSTADRILHKEVHNASEALNLLYEAAAESRSESDAGKSADTNFEARFSEKDNANTLAWRDFWCVKAGWMTDVEARCYIDLYFPACISLAKFQLLRVSQPSRPARSSCSTRESLLPCPI